MPILAAEDPTVKIIIGVVVAVFWIVSQIFGVLTKKPDKSLPPSNRRPPRQPPPVRPPGQVTRQKPPPIRTPRRPTIAAPQPMTSPPIRRQTAAQPSAAAVTPVPKPMPRNDMLRALLKSRNLKRTYVLTELLQPPVSLRPNDDRLN